MSACTDRLLLYCRAGFEQECAAEILERAAALGVAGQVEARPEAAFVVFVPNTAENLLPLRKRLRFASLTFARQLIFTTAPALELPVGDRISVLLNCARRLSERFSTLVLDYPDTNQGKRLSTFVRKFAPLFRQALERSTRLDDPQAPRLHLFWLSSAAAYVGLSIPGNSSPWPLGIPRLKLPRGAPSRSTLKLEEAFQTFLENPPQALRPGLTAVDLGAAPGGWTWQLVRRHIHTVAVDNGPLDPALLESGLVEHRRTDGFRYRPAKPVDWLVCDMLEQPARIAALVGDWLARGWCRHAIFNLKLPMKKRYEEVQRCRSLIEARLRPKGIRCRLAFKQLYHDRAEVTGYATLS
ncbi:23S rRNA (cytidine(2498)-2'-O)-methyltransferase RlmM [Candidatus Methylocalor cossyra]|uniref:Ribosomal RNA large subunit methyltransferase M n=1 Tax=Candidatus Methylocalor cossyra TaxID=3108543 RepID=A0ABM9NFE3_9GAMM